MASTEVSVLFKGTDQGVMTTASKTGGALDKLGKTSENTNKKMAGSWKNVALGIAGVYLAVTQIKRAFDSLVNAYKKQIEAETKLQSALKATGNAVGINFNEMKRMATAMSEITAIGDENIIAAQGLLVTFTKIGKDVFPQALRAAADMSTMFGQDLQQSVIQLGTALNDPIAGVGRLRRIGISFSEDQKKSIAQFVEQNDLMAAQAVILDELKVEFGGVAAAMGQMPISALNRFQNAVGDLMEEVGGVLIEGAQPFFDDMSKFLNEQRDNITAIFRNFPQIMATIFAAIPAIIGESLASPQFTNIVSNMVILLVEGFKVATATFVTLLGASIASIPDLFVAAVSSFGAILERSLAGALKPYLLEPKMGILEFEKGASGNFSTKTLIKEYDAYVKEWDEHNKFMEERSAETAKSIMNVMANASAAVGDLGNIMETAFSKVQPTLKDTQNNINKLGEGESIQKLIADLNALLAVDKATRGELKKGNDDLLGKQAQLNDLLKIYTDAWTDVLSVAEQFQDPLNKQEEELKKIQERLLSYSSIFEKGTSDFEQWSLVLSQIDDQLLEIQSKRAGIENIVNRYASVFKSESDALKAREKVLKDEIQTLLDYKRILEDKVNVYKEEGKSVEKLTTQIDEINRVTDLMGDELDQVQKDLKGSSRNILNMWDVLFGDIFDVFKNFAEDAKQKYAERAGVDVTDLTKEEESTAVQMGILTEVLTGFAGIVSTLANSFINLITSSDAWQEMMSVFNDTLKLIVEEAITPLLDALKPLLDIIIVIMTNLVEVIAPVFQMLGILIISILPFFQVLGDIVIALAQVFVQLFPPILTIISILATALMPVLRTLAVLFDILSVVIEVLNPVFELLAFVIRVVATPIAVLGAIFEWIGNVIHNLGKFINNVIDHPLSPRKWSRGMKDTDLAGMIEDAVADIWEGPTVNDFTSTIPDFETPTSVTEGTTIFGGGTTVTQVPDINIHQHFNAPVIGEGGKESIGEYVVQAIQDYLGVGGTVSWLENNTEVI